MTISANKKKDHADQMRQWLLVDSGLDYFPTGYEQENMKRHYGEIFKAYENGKANMDELLSAAEGRLRGLFFRSAYKFAVAASQISCFRIDVIE